MSTFAITPSGPMFVLGIHVWSPSGYHPYEDLAKYNFKSKIKYAFLIIFLYNVFIFFSIFVMWEGWQSCHKRFNNNGNDPTKKLNLMKKTFEEIVKTIK